MVVVIDPAGRLCFFVGAAVGLASRPYFFVGVTMGLVIGEMVDLAIGGAVLTRADIAIGFSGLFLW